MSNEKGEAAASKEMTGAGTLAEIWSSRVQEMEKNQLTEAGRAKEIAKRLCDEKLTAFTWREMETFLCSDDRAQLLFEVTICNQDSESVRKENPATDCVSGSGLIRRAAEAYILISNQDDLPVTFDYSTGKCAGNQFVIVVHKKKKGGDN